MAEREFEGPSAVVPRATVSRHDLDELLAPLAATIVALRSDGSVAYASPCLTELLGYEPHEVEGRSLADHLHPDDLSAALEALARWDGRLGEVTGPRARLRHRDGRWIDLVVDTTTGPRAAPLGAAVVAIRPRDADSEIHQRLRQRLRHQDRLARLVALFVDRSPDAFDRGIEEALTEIGSLEYLTRVAVYRTAGEDVVRTHVWEAPANAPTGPLPARLSRAGRPLLGRVVEGEVLNIASVAELGDDVALERDELLGRGVVSYLAVPMQLRGAFVGMVAAEVTIEQLELSASHVLALRTAAAVFSDAFARQDAQRALTFRALHDPVTGLVNRSRFEEVIAAGRHPSGDHGAGIRRMAEPDGAVLVMLDIDGFKLVNDALGHAVGDELLRHTAARLRSAAGDRAVLARLDGDDFACLVPDVRRGDAERCAEALVEAVSGVVDLWGHELRVTARAGVVHAAELGAAATTPREWLAAAEAAIARADRPGAPRVVCYDHEVAAERERRGWIDAELPQALEHHELRLHYQPEVDLRTGDVVGVEALLRWDHAERGLLTAGAFVGYAEHTAVFGAVSDWVLSEACRQSARWAAQGSRVALRLNLSSRDISRPGLDARLASVLADSGADPGLLCVEITETAVLTDPVQARDTCLALREMGVRIAVDDFGTGHWSMQSLRELPLDVLKIDRVLVAGIDRAAASAGVVGAILRLAANLRLDVVAEGIETPAELAVLRDLGCPRGQGFLLGSPVPADEVVLS